MYDIELYQTASGNVPLRRYFREIKKRFGPGEFNSIRLYVDLLVAHGMKINNYHPHSIRQIDGDLYELDRVITGYSFFTFEMILLCCCMPFGNSSNKHPNTRSILHGKEWKTTNGGTHNGTRKV